MTTNQLAVVVPAGLTLPAHLQTADVAAQIAAANAAAAGGIKTGGFPSISIRANKFHIREGGELHTLYAPAVAGQPAIPMMCLEIAVVAANPGITKAYFPGEFEEGKVEEPACRSSNGVTPDADVAEKQNPVCATCKQNAWGSKISKFSGAEIKACDDSKQLAVLPANDLSFKALGFQIKKGSLKNWGKHYTDMTERGYPIIGSVTNVTFDATQNGVLNFGFNRFLTAEETDKLLERAKGSDVKVIVAQSRTLGSPALPAPVTVPALTAPVQPAAATVTAAPAPAGTSTPATPAAAAVPSTGFGAQSASGGFIPPNQPATVLTTAQSEPPKRTRRTRAQIEADNAAATGQPVKSVTGSIDLSYLPPAIANVINTVGADSPAGVALLAQYPAPKQTAVDPLAHIPPAIRAVIESVGKDSPAGQALIAQYTVQPAAPASATPPVVVPPVVPPVAPTLPPAPAPAAPTTGFGAMGAPASVNQAPSAAVISAGASLAEKLKARLAQGVASSVTG